MLNIIDNSGTGQQEDANMSFLKGADREDSSILDLQAMRG